MSLQHHPCVRLRGIRVGGARVRSSAGQVVQHFAAASGTRPGKRSWRRSRNAMSCAATVIAAGLRGVVTSAATGSAGHLDKGGSWLQIPSKRCSRCRETKPLGDFAWRYMERGLHDSYCRPCRSAYKKEHYQRNKDRYRAQSPRLQATDLQAANRMAPGLFPSSPLR